MNPHTVDRNYKASSRVLTLVLSLTFIVVLAMLYPYKTVDVKSPAHVWTPVVRAGDVMTYEVDYCKYTDNPATVSRQIVDGTTITFTPMVSLTEKGCDVVNASIIIPEYVSSGTYRLVVHLSYKMNSIRVIEKRFETEEFKIVGIVNNIQIRGSIGGRQ